MNVIELLNERKLRVHGNGFIQCDINPFIRLHFWGDAAIPTQKVLTPIHDHTFGFESRVIKGEMINIRFHFNPMSADFKVYRAVGRDGADMLEHKGEWGTLIVADTDNIIAGDDYLMSAGQIHHSFAYMPTVTMLFKDRGFLGPSMNGPRVFVPFDIEPDNDFKRDAFDQNRLRKICFRILDGLDFEVPV